MKATSPHLSSNRCISGSVVGALLIIGFAAFGEETATASARRVLGRLGRGSRPFYHSGKHGHAQHPSNDRRISHCRLGLAGRVPPAISKFIDSWGGLCRIAIQAAFSVFRQHVGEPDGSERMSSAISERTSAV
jgi:hypothetical protein